MFTTIGEGGFFGEIALLYSTTLTKRGIEDRGREGNTVRETQRGKEQRFTQA